MPSERDAVMRRRPNEQLHIHIENTGSLGPVFQVTDERMYQALKKFPSVADRVRITIGQDGDIYDREIRTANILFGWRFDQIDLKARAPQLKWIHVHGAGVSHLLPLDWLPEGSVVTNSRGVHGDRASEYTIMAVLALNNRLPEMLSHQRSRTWKQLFNTGIHGKTLLIVGVGSVGGGTAAWAKQFGMKVIGIRRTGEAHPDVDGMFLPKDLDALLPEADFVLVTAPHTKLTHHMLGERQINLLKNGTGIINYSRANLVDYEALRKRLEKREISAVLDVFDPEPLPADSPLWCTPNLIITPHCSSDDTERYTPKTLDLFFRNVAKFLNGEKLINEVRPELGY